MKIENLIRLGIAAHYTYLVESPFQQRGGILLVAGPGNMKSTIVEVTLKQFPNALVYGDLTLKQLAVVRSQIANGIYTSLGFLELEKIYARNQSVAMNFEGVMKAMVEEGFAHFAFEDKRCWVPVARCFMYASVLDSLYRFHFPRWEENGFLRRFLVVKYNLSHASREKIKEAIHEGELIDMPTVVIAPGNMMRLDVTREESIRIQQIINSDEKSFTPMNLLRKTLTILKWMHKHDKNRRKRETPMEVLEDLKEGIGPLGGQLEL